jgi:hypothetical protein
MDAGPQTSGVTGARQQVGSIAPATRRDVPPGDRDHSAQSIACVFVQVWERYDGEEEVDSMGNRNAGRRSTRQRRRPEQAAVDPHVRIILDSIGAMLDVRNDLMGAEDPATRADERMTRVIDELTTAFAAAEPARIIEIARMRCLPWAHLPVEARSDGGPTRAELIALLALTAKRRYAELEPELKPGLDADSEYRTTENTPPKVPQSATPTAEADVSGEVEPQPLTNLVYEAVPSIDLLLQLAQARAALAHDPTDKFATIAVKMRGAEVWMRNTSYPDRVETTVRELFADPEVSAALATGLGFDVDVALRVLQTCHALQVQALNDRMKTWRDRVDATMQAHPHGLNTDQRNQARREWNNFWDPDTATVTVTAAQVATAASLPIDQVEAVFDAFRFDPTEWTARDLVGAYTGGNNPLRTNPVIDAENGRYMLVHDAHILTAVRENFEQYLKGSATWEQYQAFRGKVLETRTETAVERVLPDADAWHGFEYYVPADSSEVGGPVARYTKRVEGDHLFIVDDVAIIVEDKAVAVSPLARAGETRKVRSDLTRIIEKAVDQAGRLQDRIENDGGIRLHNSGWLDLSKVREIHTVAVSLDDLPGAATATAELVDAGFIDPAHITWTVSLHDLDLITELVDHPAEFLLYLRRRTDPLATVMYTAPDELDLFLHFLRSGLYVEPDPDEVRQSLPHLPPPTTAELRRFKRQQPAYLASLTDDLDDWHRARTAPAGDRADTTAEADNRATDMANLLPRATPAKPSMATSALQGLLDELRHRRDFGWLSISATLLANATASQEKMARIPRDLLRNPFQDGRGRSQTIPIGAPRGEGWLLAWMTRPPTRDIGEIVHEARLYLQAKKHQLGLPRAVAFVYDERTQDLAEVVYDAHRGDLSAEAQARLGQLRPPTAMTSPLPPKAKKSPSKQTNKPGRSARTNRGKKRKRGRR